MKLFTYPKKEKKLKHCLYVMDVQSINNFFIFYFLSCNKTLVHGKDNLMPLSVFVQWCDV